MYKNFSEISASLKNSQPIRVVVASAQDAAVLQAIQGMYHHGFAQAILVGDSNKIKAIMDQLEFDIPIDIIHEKDARNAALISAELVSSGKADILMKGLINSSDFLKAILDHKSGLRTQHLLSHLATFEIPGFSKLAFYTDGGMNLFPDLKDKIEITVNGIEAMHSIGIENPNVAVLTANEVINPKMPATVDAASLVEMNQDGKLPRCRMEGPIALDVALSPDAAVHKGIQSEISGNVDLFIVPNIEAGNMIGKSLMYYAGAKMAGVILGAACPIVMTSRAENAEGKINSIALASLIKNKIDNKIKEQIV